MTTTAKRRGRPAKSPRIDPHTMTKEGLYEQYKPLLWKLAIRLHNTEAGQRFGSEEDLVQEGAIALFEAARNYDPTKGALFFTWAYHWCWGKMRAATDRNSGIIHVPAQHFDHKGPQVTFHQEAIRAQLPMARLHYRDDGDRGLAATEPDGGLDFDVREVMLDSLYLLDRRSRAIFRYRFGLHEYPVLNLEQIGQLFDLSRERVRQIQGAGIKRIRKHLAVKLRGWPWVA